jgi:RNA polymerase subunit RPABC4/transcription elongation factor Spt4
MKFCSNCKHITPGDPKVCNRCGRTYDVKLCPRMHSNPRAAEFCSECGSRDLSTPQPRSSVWIDVLLFLSRKLGWVLLLVLSVWVSVVFIKDLRSDPLLQLRFIVLLALLGLLWYCYTQLPTFLKRMIHSGFKRMTRKRDERGHR